MPNHRNFLRPRDVALAFRGYNVTNLGRTAEILAHPKLGPAMERRLSSVSVVAVDLVAQVRAGQELLLEQYGEALALLLAVEAAQLELLRDVFDVDWRAARFSYGFSLGEVGAVVAGGVFNVESALAVLLPLADDC